MGLMQSRASSAARLKCLWSPYHAAAWCKEDQVVHPVAHARASSSHAQNRGHRDGETEAPVPCILPSEVVPQPDPRSSLKAHLSKIS